MKLEIYVLSLPDAYERREKFEKNFRRNSKNNFEFFDGVYGKNLDKETIKNIYDDEKAIKKIGRSLTLGEIGATYSHFLMYKLAIERDLDFLVVLEDDAFVNNSFDSICEYFMFDQNEEIKEGVFFIQEHTLNEKVILSKKQYCNVGKAHRLRRMLGSTQYFVGSYGYILSRNVIEKMIKNYLPLYYVCDHWFFVRKNNKIDKFYCLEPSVVHTNEECVREHDSFINNERKNVIKKVKLSALAKTKIKVKKSILTLLDKDWE